MSVQSIGSAATPRHDDLISPSPPAPQAAENALGANPAQNSEPIVTRFTVEPYSRPKPSTEEGWDWDRIAIIGGLTAISMLIVLEAVMLSYFN